MSNADFYKKYQLDESVAIQAGFNPYYPLISSGLGDPVMIGDKEFIDLASNNYLGLANDPRVKEAAMEGIERYGVSLCGTPVASGYSKLFRETEEALAEFTDLDDVIIYPSCYQANNGLFQVILGPGDLVIIDRFAHSSLYEGIRSTGCPFRIFRHNDMQHLEDLLIRKRCQGQVFVVTESVFSTEGSIAPFGKINALCEQYGAIPVVDDSHGIGVLGRRGSGALSHFGIEKYGGIYTASLGKALGVSGGMVAGRASLIRYLRFSSSHLIYSTAISPASLNALLRVMVIIDNEYKALSERLWTFTDWLWEGLVYAGFELTDSQTPINSIKSGNSVQTLKLAKWFYEKGILTTPFIYPSVPENEGRIRIIAGANLEASSIEYVVDCANKYHEVLV
jgi:7-keto-8-aminopelargonate synthetase-like enzyme